MNMKTKDKKIDVSGSFNMGLGEAFRYMPKMVNKSYGTPDYILVPSKWAKDYKGIFRDEVIDKKMKEEAQNDDLIEEFNAGNKDNT